MLCVHFLRLWRLEGEISLNHTAAVTGLTLIRFQFISDWSQPLSQKWSGDTVDGAITDHDLLSAMSTY